MGGLREGVGVGRHGRPLLLLQCLQASLHMPYRIMSVQNTKALRVRGSSPIMKSNCGLTRTRASCGADSQRGERVLWVRGATLPKVEALCRFGPA